MMRASVRGGIFAAAFLLPAMAVAQDEEGALDLVPVVDPNAPICTWSFSADPSVAASDAKAIDELLADRLDHRTDIRLLPRPAAEEKLKQAGRSFEECAGKETCLVDLAQTLGVSRLLVMSLRSQTPALLRLDMLRLDTIDPPGKLSVRTEGSLAELIAGGAAGGLQALMENKTQALATTPAQPPPAPPARRPPAPSPPPRLLVERPPEPPRIDMGVDPPGFFRRHWLSTLALGAGLLSGALGITFGVMSQQIADEMSGDPSGQHQFDPDRDRMGKSYALAANVLFGVAGAATLASAALFFFAEDDDDSSVSVVPAGLGVGARLRF